MSEEDAFPELANLTEPVTTLRGVGPDRAALLAALEIRTWRDLLLHRPRRYEDRSQLSCVGALVSSGASVAVCGPVVDLGVKRFARGRKSVFELIVDDGTGRLHCRWWNAPYMERQFTVGETLFVYGRVTGLRPRTMDHPEVESMGDGEDATVHVNRWVPIYPLTEGVSQRWLRSQIWRLLPEGVSRLLPSKLDALALGFLPVAEALRALHFPETKAEAEAARQRWALAEWFQLQWSLQQRRSRLRARAQEAKSECVGDNRWVRPFVASLPFALTEAQKRVLREIRHDLASAVPMRRLLQGDVGSGKTVVAACAALICLEAGRRVLLMAPTEILARQHYRNFSRWWVRVERSVALVTAGGRIEGAESGMAADLVIGTHALLEDDIRVENVGLVVIDEQHKFGVAQRERLLRKGVYPHLLVMTATPIPRTLGLTVYGDLDVSVIDARPEGRPQVRTFLRGRAAAAKVWAFVREQLGAGQQVFVVYPRVSTPGSGDVKALTEEIDGLSQALRPYAVGGLHGRQSAAEKERVMRDFSERRLGVLVATSLIEVGVDVPTANVMVVENAEQFGLAQLHQLRGRIGRGKGGVAYFILMVGGRDGAAAERLRILTETDDGFRIAEEDLRQRGPGVMLGREQSGRPDFRFADLMQDGDLLGQARAAVLRARTTEGEVL